ncbi:F-box protein [Pyrus ussuriensis x Pyrus communis]|uniref:F-box protein n=1 Tax=Pyrus ussuriensis x Pyrus communis TaxID=2448454 RepID=A0A5N5HYD7_9ROSA|nr:F-box protein [Pyrus ussuriensis x Pyrus communis]
MAPWEVLDLVSHHLDPKSLAISSCVCKSWFISLSCDHNWQPISAAKRCLQTPWKPRLSLDSLIFIVNVFNPNSLSIVLFLEKFESELVIDPNEIFKFDMMLVKIMDLERGRIRIQWQVFGMMDCEGKEMEGWFSEELPSPVGCCSSVVGRGIVADLKLGLCDGRRVNKVSVGMLSVADRRYVSVDDALRYLQHFLLPCF